MRPREFVLSYHTNHQQNQGKYLAICVHTLRYLPQDVTPTKTLLFATNGPPAY